MEMNIEKVKEILENLDENDLISVWNSYCDLNNYYEDRIYGMYEIDDLFYDVKASDFLDKLSGDFNHNDEYFKDSIYGLESFNYASDVVDFDDLAKYIVNNEDTLDCAEIEDYLEELEEEEEEEEENEDDEE